MKNFKFVITLITVCLLSSCASQMTLGKYNYCAWGTFLASTAIGAIGGLGGAVAGAAGGAALGVSMCEPVGLGTMETAVAKEPAVAVKPDIAIKEALDSDGDGVPDAYDRCTATPAGVKVDSQGCVLDSDNDDVADYQDQCPDTSTGINVDAVGCPLAGETLLVLENVNFVYKSAALDASSIVILDQAVQVLKQNTGVDVTVEGHTDSRASEGYNQELSQRRAETVRDYLISNGVDASRLTAVGRGENSPIASNSTEEGRRKNRRVEFVVR